MVYLAQLIETVNDAELRQSLEERLDIVRHKIKFMDQVPVFCSGLTNQPNIAFYEALAAAGALVHTTASAAVYLIYMETGAGLNSLMRDVPAMLSSEWPAVSNSRVVLLDQDAYNVKDAENCTGLVEDLAEMLHPGAFVFGNEGSKWIRFA